MKTVFIYLYQQVKSFMALLAQALQIHGAKGEKPLIRKAGPGWPVFKRRVTMLSHIVNLVSTYEQSHGIRPNLVFMNETHYSYLREELPGVRDHDDVTNIIGVDIALSDEALRPHVATVTFGGNHILSS